MNSLMMKTEKETKNILLSAFCGTKMHLANPLGRKNVDQVSAVSQTAKEPGNF
jgi:hypothetical protein